MKLWVMRHGEAGPSMTEPAEERQRGLTDPGRECVRAIAREMLRQDEVPHIILSSEYSRALETADIVGEMLGVMVNPLDELGPFIPVSQTMRMLAESGAKRLMIVGHHDNLDPWIEAATGKEDPLAKGEVRRYKIDRDSGKAVLKWSLLPSEVGSVDQYDDEDAVTEA